METTDLAPIEARAELLLKPLSESVEMDYIGEPISQLEHALQCAHWAHKQGADEEVILAALFHDVGHLIDASAPQMEGLGVVNHEGLGRRFLEEHGCSSEALDTCGSARPSQALPLLQESQILRPTLRGLQGNPCLARGPDDNRRG